MIKQEEKNIKIARRVPPGDKWEVMIDQGTIHKSLTDALEAYFQKATVKPQAYRLEPMKGDLYAIVTEEVEIKPEPPKMYNIYGDYE